MRRWRCRCTSEIKWRSPNESWKVDERGPQGSPRARADARRRSRRSDGDRERDLQPSVDAGQLRRFAARRLRMPHLAAGRRAGRLFRPDGRGRRGAPSQPLDRRAAPAARSRRGAVAGSGGACAQAWRAKRVPRSAAEQPGGAGPLYALRLSQSCRAPRLLPGAQRARRRARALASPVSRREEVLAEMGLAPIWRLRKRPVEPAVVQPGWIELKQAVPACTACGLHKSRTQTVFGVGDENADWLLIGEAPGAEEDRLGGPFVGQAGKIADNMLAAIGLKRGENLYTGHLLQMQAARD